MQERSEVEEKCRVTNVEVRYDEGKECRNSHAYCMEYKIKMVHGPQRKTKIKAIIEEGVLIPV